jgi:hypothetical protein
MSTSNLSSIPPETIYLYPLHIPEIKTLDQFANVTKELCSHKYYGLKYEARFHMVYGELEITKNGLSIWNSGYEYTSIAPELIYSVNPGFEGQGPSLMLEIYYIPVQDCVIGDKVMVSYEGDIIFTVTAAPLCLNENDIRLRFIDGIKIFNKTTTLKVLRIHQLGG